MRTLVISDLHLGSRRPVDILRRPEPLDELCAFLGTVDRLVLLGDILEMRHGPAWEAMAAARPVMEAIGSALPAGSEIVIAAGNHDFPLVAQWLDRRRLEAAPEPLGEQTLSDPSDSAIAAQLAGWLDDGRHEIGVAYPGYWVREDIWATHGHYLDRLITIPTFERLAAGGMARVVGRLPEETGSASAEDFEAALAPMYAWLEELANGRAAGGRWTTGAATAKAWTMLSGDGRAPLRGKALAAMLPLGIAGINLAGLGPVSHRLDSDELRRAGLAAMAEVVRLMGVQARWVIFGHTHCAGPLPWMVHREWEMPRGGSLLNTGCWTDEPRINSTDVRSPYRPGRGVLVDGDADPEPLMLVEDVGRRPEHSF
jgi:hypothetical protein